MSRFAAMRRSFDDSGDKQPPNLPNDPIPTPQIDPRTGEYVPVATDYGSGGGNGSDPVDPGPGAQPRGMLGNSLALNGQYAPVTLADYLAASHGSLLSNSFVPQAGGMVGGAISDPSRFGYAANGMTVTRSPSGGYTQGMSNVDSYIGMNPSGPSLEQNQAHTKETPEADRPPSDPYTPPRNPRPAPVDPDADPVQAESKYKRLNDSFGGF